MKHLREQLIKYQGKSERQAEVSAANGYPNTAARYEGRAEAFELALALLDGALAGQAFPQTVNAEKLKSLKAEIRTLITPSA